MGERTECRRRVPTSTGNDAVGMMVRRHWVRRECNNRDTSIDNDDRPPGTWDGSNTANDSTDRCSFWIDPNHSCRECPECGCHWYYECDSVLKYSPWLFWWWPVLIHPMFWIATWVVRSTRVRRKKREKWRCCVKEGRNIEK
jgi:hypothetical protein